jgi:hypothetical protein
MAQPDFTPGPWKYRDTGDGRGIVFRPDAPELFVRPSADARLISAAPDLYAAARDINTLLRNLSVNVECATKELANEFYEVEARLRAAIAKADGDAA